VPPSEILRVKGMPGSDGGQTIDPIPANRDDSKPEKTDRSDPRHPAKWLETSDPNSFLVTCNAKRAFDP
jgi:hypothetical protein